VIRPPHGAAAGDMPRHGAGHEPEQTVFGIEFQNPVLLASGTCGYGAELDGFFDIDRSAASSSRRSPPTCAPATPHHASRSSPPA
jgi:hypothetical protein